MYFVPEGQHDSSQARSAWTGVWTFREGKTRRQATSGAERSRAHCIIGVPPVFPICAKGDDQKLESQTLRGASRRCAAVIPQTQRLRRDAYATFRSASGHLRAERSRAHCIIGVPPVFPICAKGDDQKLESQTLRGASRRCAAVIPQ